MKAVILAGGRGRRLGHLTRHRAKPMVEVRGKPILEHLISAAAAAGISEFLIALGHQGQSISNHFRDGADVGVRIEYTTSQGTGPEASLLAAREWVTTGDFCCFCGDTILTNSQIRRLVTAHANSHADATVTVERGRAANTKRIKVDDGRVIGSSRDLSDHVLVYNMVMSVAFLDAAHDVTRSKRDKALAFAMDVLADVYLVRVANIGPFININCPEDIQMAEDSLLRPTDL